MNQPGGTPAPTRPVWAFVALGSNLGDSSRLIREATDQLQRLSVEPVLRSSLWTSLPVDCPPGSPPFINAAVGLRPNPGLTPEELLSELQAIEKRLGRLPKRVHNEPRTLDLDLIAFGDAQRDSPALTLPHPRAHMRTFVLLPLNEIAPDLVLPGQTRSVKELLGGLGPSESVRRYSP